MTFLYGAGLLIGILISVALALTPSIAYILMWLCIPKTPIWMIIIIIGGGSTWIVAQFSLFLIVCMWRCNGVNRKETFWEGMGGPSSAVLFTLLGLMPTLLYAALWWLVPKKLEPMYFCAFPGFSIWLIAQITWVQNLAVWWKSVFNSEEEGFESLAYH